MNDRFCKDCRFCKPDPLIFWKRFEFSKCKHPMSFMQDQVTGALTQLYCDVVRGSFVIDRCGKEGRYFEAKHER